MSLYPTCHQIQIDYLADYMIEWLMKLDRKLLEPHKKLYCPLKYVKTHCNKDC